MSKMTLSGESVIQQQRKAAIVKSSGYYIADTVIVFLLHEQAPTPNYDVLGYLESNEYLNLNLGEKMLGLDLPDFGAWGGRGSSRHYVELSCLKERDACVAARSLEPVMLCDLRNCTDASFPDGFSDGCPG